MSLTRVSLGGGDDLSGVDRGRADLGDRRRTARADRYPRRAAQRAPGAHVGDHGRGPSAADPQAAHRGIRLLPALLERRRRVDQALYAVVMEAYLHGVSTRKVDDLVKALGADSGISKSEVSRYLRRTSMRRSARSGPAPSRTRSTRTSSWDATYCKARVNRRVVSQAVVVATAGCAPTGTARSSGSTSATVRTGRFGPAFPQVPEGPWLARGEAGHLRRPRRPRRPRSPRCSSARPGNAAGCTSCATSSPAGPKATPRWSPPRSARSSPNPTPPTCVTSSTSLRPCSGRQLPVVESMLREAADDILALHLLSPGALAQDPGPPTPWSGSTRRSNDAPTSSASSPTPKPSLRLAGAVLVETHDEWAAGDRRYLSAVIHEDHQRPHHQGSSHHHRAHGIVNPSKASRDGAVTPLHGTHPALVPHNAGASVDPAAILTPPVSQIGGC